MFISNRFLKKLQLRRGHEEQLMWSFWTKEGNEVFQGGDNMAISSGWSLKTNMALDAGSVDQFWCS